MHEINCIYNLHCSVAFSNSKTGELEQHPANWVGDNYSVVSVGYLRTFLLQRWGCDLWEGHLDIVGIYVAGRDEKQNND